jgi:hypothetical protein
MRRCGVIGAVMVLGISLFSGCKSRTTEDTTSWMFDYTGKAYSSDGVLHNEQGYMYYLDAETSQDDLICNDSSCNHKKDSCSAYFDAIYTSGIIEDDSIVLVTDYGGEQYGDICLYSADLNGTNRKKTTKFKQTMQAIENIYIDSDYVIVSYYNQYDENMEETELPSAGLYVYDRATGSGMNLVMIEMWNSRIPSFALVEDTLYFSYLGFTITKEEAILHEEDSDYFEEHKVSAVYSVPLGEDCEKKSISDLEEVILCDDVSNMQSGSAYFLYDQADTTYVYDIVQRKSTEIGSMNGVATDNADGLYLTEYNRETGRELFFYTYETGTLQDLGRLKDDIILDGVAGDTFYVWEMAPSDSDTEDVFAAYAGESSVIE